MSKLRIFTFPDLVLAKKAEPIVRVEKTLFKLADDMLETMYEEPGVGLAANQVGLLQRIIVIDADYDLEELPEGVAPPQGVEVAAGNIIRNKQPRIMINPEITYREGNVLSPEGCLSVPDYYAKVSRAEKVKVQYQTIDGETKTLAAEGLLAKVIQHEIDHLDGRLFIDRLSPLKKEMIKKKLKQARQEAEFEAFSAGQSTKKPKGF